MNPYELGRACRVVYQTLRQELGKVKSAAIDLFVINTPPYNKLKTQLKAQEEKASGLEAELVNADSSLERRKSALQTLGNRLRRYREESQKEIDELTKRVHRQSGLLAKADEDVQLATSELRKAEILIRNLQIRRETDAAAVLFNYLESQELPVPVAVYARKEDRFDTWGTTSDEPYVVQELQAVLNTSKNTGLRKTLARVGIGQRTVSGYLCRMHQYTLDEETGSGVVLAYISPLHKKANGFSKFRKMLGEIIQATAPPLSLRRRYKSPETETDR